MLGARLVSITVLLVSGSCAHAAADKAADGSAAQALAPVFQADMPTALERLVALPDRALTDRQRRTRDCIVARFRGPTAAAAPESLPAPAGDVLAAYRRYWTTSLMHTARPEQAEARLSAELAPFAASEAHDLEAREAAAAAAIGAKGLFVLGGLTPPLQEFMLWRKEGGGMQTVELPGGRIDVRVTLLDDFASLGWAAWATCDAAHTGGWTTADGIMVVAPSWDLASEDYRISLLAHEAQHFSDYRRYPKLAPPDLEYRAKLVELMLARDTQQALLDKFSAEAERNRAPPHPFASWWLMARLRGRLGGDPRAAEYSGEAVRQAAAAELQAHSAALDAKVPATAGTALPD
jgi:hypothetical protein